MARISEVVVMKGRTINLGDRNFAKFEFGLTAKLDEGEKYKEVYEKVNKEVDDLVDTEHGKLRD
ncbi:MAG: hypothetical protein AM326_12315 [Candidatus Thorarchaeota archaeon SMTZ-45]|nr:MAG: hypothetical protein AM326_12315 [Candidatus Thorarchaeota archaeon SMTZ-45]